MAAGDLGDQGDHAIHRIGDHLRVESPLKAPGGVGAEAQTLRGFHNVAPVEGGDLYKDVGRLFADFGGLGTHDTGDNETTLLVGDDEHFLLELPGRTVEKGHSLAGVPPANYDAPTDLAGGKAVNRLAGLQHNVVRRVNDRVYGTHPGGVNATAHLQGSSLTRTNVRDAPQIVAGAEVSGFDPQAVLRSRGTVGGELGLGNAKRAIEDGGQLTSYPYHAPKIRSVGRDIYIEDGLADGEVVLQGPPNLV